MSTPRVGKEFKLLVYAENYWAKGVTEKEALKDITQRGGKARGKTYIVFLVSPATQINDMGDLVYPEGDPRPIIIKVVRNGKEIDPASAAAGL